MFTKNPFQNALGLTALALIVIVPALMGCDLQKGANGFPRCGSWSTTVLWGRVGIGIAILLPAGYFWRRGIKSIRSSNRTASV